VEPVASMPPDFWQAFSLDELAPRQDVGVEEGEEPQAQTPGGGLAAWQAAREKVVVQLRALSQAIVEAKDPDARRGVILLQSIIKNLTAKPESKQQVQELRRYLQTDEVIEDAESPNPFGLTIDLKQPLLSALDGIDRELAA